MIVISGTNGIDMNVAALIGASQIDSVFINENGVSVATDAEVSSAVAPKANTSDVNTQLGLKANTADLKEIGVGQTWQSFTVGTQRISGTTYTNSTGKPITVFLNININTGGGATMVINGLSTSINIGYSGVAIPYTIIVPNGNTYQITAPQGISIWAELR